MERILYVSKGRNGIETVVMIYVSMSNYVTKEELQPRGLG